MQDEQVTVNQQFADQQNKIEKVNLEFSTAQRLVQDKLSIVRQDITKANQKEKEYASKNIEQLLVEHEAKPEYEREQLQIQAQLTLLTANQQDVETRYQADKQRLETQCQQQILDSELSQIKEKEKLQLDLANFTTAFYLEKERLTADQNNKLDEQNKEKTAIERKIREVDFSIESIPKTHFLKEEQDNWFYRYVEFDRYWIQNQKSLINRLNLIDFHDVPVNSLTFNLDYMILSIGFELYNEKTGDYNSLTLDFENIQDLETDKLLFDSDTDIEITRFDYEYSDIFEGKLSLLTGHGKPSVVIELKCEKLKLKKN